MEQPNSKFKTMGNSAATTVKNVSGSPAAGKLMKRKNTAAGDPYAQPKPSRTKVKATGRHYAITAKMPSYVDPQVGPTQGNGRIFKAAVNRTAPNFKDGMTDLN